MKRILALTTLAALLLGGGAGLTVAATASAPVETVMGKSVNGADLVYSRWNAGPGRPALLVCGFHGDERLAFAFCGKFIEEMRQKPGLLQGRPLIAVHLLNPDGRGKNTRGNARGVDLNRNFEVGWEPAGKGKRYNPGARPLSEPESAALRDLVLKEKPWLIITVHQPMKMIDHDGPAPAAEIAGLMGKKNGYRVSSTIGYPTPGSFGTYTSSLAIPNICLELPGGSDVNAVWKGNYDAVLAAITWNGAADAPPKK